VTDLEIHPLTPDRWPDIVDLFREGGDPKWCWCMFYRLRAKDFAANRIVDNRAALEALASDAASGSRPAPGLVAYQNARPVGWVSVGPREDYERLRRSKVIPAVDDRPVWSVTCFVVGERVRGNGLVRPLLDAAITFARDHGAEALEAYPVDTEGERMSPNALWTGTIGTFRAVGFRVVGSRLSQQGEARPERPIVRLELAAPAAGMDK
jgi:ribosomal protein S18 acetylase RimI-like enzyme